MAQVPNKVASLGTISAFVNGATFAKVGPVRKLDNTALDLSGWEPLKMRIFDANIFDSGDPIYEVPEDGGTVTGNADGTIDIKMAANALAAHKPGSYTFVVWGENDAADGMQILGTGTLTYATVG